MREKGDPGPKKAKKQPQPKIKPLKKVLPFDEYDEILDVPPYLQKKYKAWKRAKRRAVNRMRQTGRVRGKARKTALLRLERELERERKRQEREARRLARLAWMRLHHIRSLGPQPDLDDKVQPEDVRRHNPGSLAGFAGNDPTFTGLVKIKRSKSRTMKKLERIG